MRLRVLVALIGSVTLLLIGAGSAFAAVTTSTVTVTSPTGTYLLDDQVTPNEAISGTGTSNGSSGDKVDINCYDGTTSKQLAANVTVGTGGAFTFSGSLADINDATCVLRAVPAGDSTDYPPGGSAPFTGPTLAISEVSNSNASGSNSSLLESYYLADSQLKGGYDYDSLGGCTIDDSYTYDPVTLGDMGTESGYLDYCNAWFDSQNGDGSPGAQTPTRSELQVDNADAYAPGSISNLFTGSDALPGFPSLTYTYSLDRSTGNLVINETDQVVKCSPGGYPASVSNCTSFVPTGIRVTQRITQAADGRVATVTQYFSSTDGHSHNVDMLEDNNFYTINEDGQLNFPWTGSGLSAYTTVGQQLAGPSSPGPGSFYVKGSASVPDGGTGAPQGSVTFAAPPSGVTIVGTTNRGSDYSWVDLHYTRTVPAGGSVALGFTYGNAWLANEVAGYASAAEASYRPSLSINSPSNGASTNQPSVTVSGTAQDATGVSSVSVNGHAATLGSGGAWSASVPLTHGSNTLTAVVTNVFGNTAQASRTVTTSAGPALTNVKQSRRKWKRSKGTTFSFTLNQAAQVKFVFTQKLKGRKVHGKCVAQTKRNAKQPKCKLTKKRGSLTVSGQVGSNTLNFKGKLPNGHKLKPGTYTLAVTGSAGGGTSKTTKLTFTILK